MPEPARAGAARRRWSVVVLAGVAMLLGACQVNVDVGTKLEEDGSGVITVGAGFDDAALSRLGRPELAVKVDDLRAAGWEFQAPVREADGFTWYRGAHRFATPEEGTRLLEQLSGGTGPFRDFALTKETGFGRTTWAYKGTVDLTGGLASFGDPALTAALGGDALGGNIAAVEKEEGKPVSQMLALEMTAELPGGEKKEWRPSLADPAPTRLSAESSKVSPLPMLSTDGDAKTVTVVLGLLVGGLVIVLLVVLRRRFRSY